MVKIGGLLASAVAAACWLVALFLPWTDEGALSSVSLLDAVEVIRRGSVDAVVPSGAAVVLLVPSIASIIVIGVVGLAGRGVAGVRAGALAVGSLGSIGLGARPLRRRPSGRRSGRMDGSSRRTLRRSGTRLLGLRDAVPSVLVALIGRRSELDGLPRLRQAARRTRSALLREVRHQPRSRRAAHGLRPGDPDHRTAVRRRRAGGASGSAARNAARAAARKATWAAARVAAAAPACTPDLRGAAARLSRSSPTAPGPPASYDVKPAGRRRTPVVLLVGAALFAALIGAGGVVLLFGDDDSPSDTSAEDRGRRLGRRERRRTTPGRPDHPVRARRRRRPASRRRSAAGTADRP